MKVELRAIPETEKGVLWRLMQLYLYDFTEVEPCDVETSGEYEYPYFDNYWTDPDRHPFFIEVDGKLAGFVLICGWTALPENESGRSIAEFFVMRRYRRRKIGSTAALLAFGMFPGRWEIRETKHNYPAQTFWRELINEYMSGAYLEKVLDNDQWRGLIQSFDNSENR
ncbi:MAG: GNAT family N-acetyltransferase [bacterium]